MVGIVPITLVDAKRSGVSTRQSTTHAEYSGVVEFHNVFEGELPAVEYPKINVRHAISFASCTATHTKTLLTPVLLAAQRYLLYFGLRMGVPLFQAPG